MLNYDWFLQKNPNLGLKFTWFNKRYYTLWNIYEKIRLWL